MSDIFIEKVLKTDVVGDLEEFIYSTIVKDNMDVHEIKDAGDYYEVYLQYKDECSSGIGDDDCCSDDCCSDDCCSSTQGCSDTCCEEVCCAANDVNSESCCEEVETKSIAYEGPWADKKFEMDIAQISAVFEAVQFCDYMIKRTQMVTPVAARSLQECQRYILENLTDFDPAQMEDYKGDGKTPMEIKIKDDFSVHLKKWQEESVELFEKMAATMAKKPQIVQATMMPQSGFDPNGPGGLRL